MKKELREKAIKLRVEDEFSYSEIKKQLGVSKSTLSYWLRDYPLSEKKIKELRRRGWEKGEASRERYRNTMREKVKRLEEEIYKKELNFFSCLSEESLYVAGLMLYLAEGGKRGRYRISLANTDPKIIVFFRDWLVRFLKVRRGDIKYQLHLYESMDVAKETKFWKNTLCIKKEQLYKSQVRKLNKNSFSYTYSHGHGTCSLYISGRDRKVKIMMAIKAFLDRSLRV